MVKLLVADGASKLSDICELIIDSEHKNPLFKENRIRIILADFVKTDELE